MGSPFIYAVSELQYNLCLVLSPTLCHCPISLFGTGSRRHLVGQGHVKVKILSQKMISLQTKSREEKKKSLFNCFVFVSIPDSRAIKMCDAIFTHAFG